MKQRFDGSIYIPVRRPADAAVRPQLSVVGAEGESAGLLKWYESGPISLELGGQLPELTVAYRTWGALNPARDNAVFILHALTGDSRATGEGGWWSPIIGPGLPVDTNQHFIVCANILGGCQGTTGPASTDPLTGRQYAMRFPLITIGDIVNVHRRLAEHLGIERLIAMGGSIGGCQALEWATRHPDMVTATVAVAATPMLGPLPIALNEAGRRAVMSDPDWRGGEYASEGVFPADGLSIARMIAMTQFHSTESMGDRFGRKPATRPSLYPSFGGTFDVEGYVHYHGAALVRRFDANSHLYLTRAMDLYDLYRDGGKEKWLGQIQAPVLVVGIRSDWLYPAAEVRDLHRDLVAAGKEVQYAELDSPNGHDAFLKDWELMREAITPFLKRFRPASEQGLARHG